MFNYKLVNENLLTIDKFKELPTKRALVYFKKYRKIEHLGTCSCCGEKYPHDSATREFYNDCVLYVNQMRVHLNTLEHVDYINK